MSELQATWPYYKPGRYEEGLRILEGIWAELSIPQSSVKNAFNVVAYGVNFAIQAEDYDQALIWADRAPSFTDAEYDSGSVEFLRGRVAFERGEIAETRELFRVANAKSGGREFEGEDPRYLASISEPSKVSLDPHFQGTVGVQGTT